MCDIVNVAQEDGSYLDLHNAGDLEEYGWDVDPAHFTGGDHLNRATVCFCCWELDAIMCDNNVLYYREVWGITVPSQADLQKMADKLEYTQSILDGYQQLKDTEHAWDPVQTLDQAHHAIRHGVDGGELPGEVVLWEEPEPELTEEDVAAALGEDDTAATVTGLGGMLNLTQETRTCANCGVTEPVNPVLDWHAGLCVPCEFGKKGPVEDLPDDDFPEETFE